MRCIKQLFWAKNWKKSVGKEGSPLLQGPFHVAFKESNLKIASNDIAWLFATWKLGR